MRIIAGPGNERLALDPRDRIPDVRDGLTRIERVVLHVLREAQQEFGGRNVPTATLYGRVLEHVDLSFEELQSCLNRLGSLPDRR